MIVTFSDAGSGIPAIFSTPLLFSTFPILYSRHSRYHTHIITDNTRYDIFTHNTIIALFFLSNIPDILDRNYIRGCYRICRDLSIIDPSVDYKHVLRESSVAIKLSNLALVSTEKH